MVLIKCHETRRGREYIRFLIKLDFSHILFNRQSALFHSRIYRQHKYDTRQRWSILDASFQSQKSFMQKLCACKNKLDQICFMGVQL